MCVWVFLGGGVLVFGFLMENVFNVGVWMENRL